MSQLSQGIKLMLLAGGTVVSAPKAVFKGDVLIEGTKIRYAGPALPADERERLARDGCRVIDAGGKAILPGFVNTHTHAAMSLLRGYAEDLPLDRWLGEKIFPVEERLTAGDVYWGTMLAIAEMIHGGTTCFADMYFFMDEVARAVEESGVRAVLSRGIAATGPDAGFTGLAEAEAFCRRWEGQAGGRITTRLGPHALYTCPPDFMEKVIASSERLGVGLHIHVSESPREAREHEKRYHESPTETLERLGCFQRPTLAAHCVHVDERDIEILARGGAGVAHCPTSNLKLANGVAPVAAMLRAGVKVGIGTDGPASNNDLDLWEETRLAAMLQKNATGDTTVLPAHEALSLASAGGAEAVGLGTVIGSLKANRQADIVVVDLEGHSDGDVRSVRKRPHLAPGNDVVADLVYAGHAADVEMVIVAGRVLLERGELLTIDEERIVAEARDCAVRLGLREA